MLSVARRLSASAKEAATLLPWWCQVPAFQQASLRGPFARCIITRGIRAKMRENARKCVIANHPAMIATS
jgi:hypothetical protein